jgi:glutamate/aspartate transport system ATP-binding protein
MPMIEVRNLNKSFGPNQVLKDCSAAVDRGEVVVICGPSGSGKSTLIKCMNGLIPADSGDILFEGVSIFDHSKKIADVRKQIGMIFQHFELFPHLSIIENLNLAQIKVLGRSKGEATDKSRSLLQRMDIQMHEHKYPAQLSGGQQQRAAIARGLAMDPKIMLFDEPTSALDPEMIGEVLEVMVELATGGMTMIVVTHEMGFARKVANRVIFMDEGRIELDCPVDAFFGATSNIRAQEFLSKILSH